MSFRVAVAIPLHHVAIGCRESERLIVRFFKGFQAAVAIPLQHVANGCRDSGRLIYHFSRVFHEFPAGCRDSVASCREWMSRIRTNMSRFDRLLPPHPGLLPPLPRFVAPLRPWKSHPEGARFRLDLVRGFNWIGWALCVGICTNTPVPLWGCS